MINKFKKWIEEKIKILLYLLQNRGLLDFQHKSKSDRIIKYINNG